jgi:hypothetical protein
MTVQFLVFQTAEIMLDALAEHMVAAEMARLRQQHFAAEAWLAAEQRQQRGGAE